MKSLLKNALQVISIILVISLWASSSINPVVSLSGTFLSVLCSVYLVGGVAFYLGAFSTNKLRAFLIKYGYLKSDRIALFVRLTTFSMVMFGAMLAFVFSFYWFTKATSPQLYYAVSSACIFIVLSQLAKAILLGFREMPMLKGQVISFGIGALVMGTLPLILR